MLTTFFVGGLAVLAALIIPLTVTIEPTPISVCSNGKYTITAPGDFVIVNDLMAAVDQPCIQVRGVGAHDITIDGNFKTITTQGKAAVEIGDFDDGPPAYVTLKNLNSTGGVSTYGDKVNHITFENLSVNSINLSGSDDDIVRDNIVGGGGIQVTNGDIDGFWPLRTQVINNVVTGGANVKTLFEVVAGKVHPCPRTDTVVTGNTFTDDRNDPPPEATAAVRIRCATHVTFTDNNIWSTGTTIGLYMRDEADDGLYENNTFRSNNQEAIRIASGKHPTKPSQHATAFIITSFSPIFHRQPFSRGWVPTTNLPTTLFGVGIGERCYKTMATCTITTRFI